MIPVLPLRSLADPEHRGQPSFTVKPLAVTRLPRHGIALLHALRFSDPDCHALSELNNSEWKQLVAICDQGQLTLLLNQYCRQFFPDWLQFRVARDYSNNSRRFARLKSDLVEIIESLFGHSIDFVILKGFAHAPDFSPDPLLRVQGDIDIWCLPEKIRDARDIVAGLGYKPFARSKGRHLDPMLRETDWQWRGDYFDPEAPIPVDLHYRLWDEQLEGIPGPIEAEIWKRRCRSIVNGYSISVLDLADTLAFAALHVLMHLLHGDLRLQRAWEIAFFLQNRADDDDFWNRWQILFPQHVRELQVLIFSLAHLWFGCRLPTLIAAETDTLPADVIFWIERYGFSPVEGLFVPNKDELWLNLALLHSRRQKLRIFARRLIPLSGVRLIGTSSNSTQKRSQQTLLSVQFFLKRAVHHARTVLPTCIGGVKWWWLRKRLSNDFVLFLLSSLLFDFGEFIFFVLYSLYLIDCGYHEKFIGQVTAALTTGTLIGVLPASAITQRYGLRKAVIVAIAGTVVSAIFRVLISGEPALLVFAFVNGLCMSIWAVLLPTAVASFTVERNRPLAFALISSSGIGIGSVAAFAGGHLPELLLRIGMAVTALDAKRAALLAGSGFALLALAPALLIQFPKERLTIGQKNYPRSPFIFGFLAALFVWSLGTGGFNPFFSVYFSTRLHLSVERIGLIFSYGQLMQVGAILLTPVIIRQMGTVASIASSQMATAIVLAILALTSNPLLASILYTGYMAFQYMSEPCLLNMLMNCVAPSERSGASGLNFVVVALAGILSAMASGALLARAGYPMTMAVCSLIMALAAVTFFLFFRKRA